MKSNVMKYIFFIAVIIIVGLATYIIYEDNSKKEENLSLIHILLLLLNAIMYLNNGMTTSDLLLNYARYIIPTFFLPILTGLLILKLDKRPIKPMIKGLLCYPLFLGSWLLINFKVLFKRDTKWEKIDLSLIHI